LRGKKKLFAVDRSQAYFYSFAKLRNYSFVYTSGSQTCSSSYPYQGSDYVLLPQYFAV